MDCRWNTLLLDILLPWAGNLASKEGAADWDEDWDKFEDKGFAFVEELTLDVLNVLAPSRQKSSSVQKEKALPVENPTTAASPEVDVKTEKPQSADANPIRTGSSQGGGFSQKSRPFTFDDFVPILGHHSQPSIQDIYRQGTRIVQNFHSTPSLGLIRSEAHKILDFFLNQKHSEDLSLCAAIESLIRVMVFQHLMTSQTLLVLRCHLGHRWTVKL